MASTSSISLYEKINYINSKETIPFDLFLDGVEGGHWEDLVNDVRLGKQDKKSMPSVTISGKFKKREDGDIDQHSGFIGIDIDDCDVNEIKEKLRADKYIYAAFVSISGRGVCVIFKINSAKHREAFQGISEYLYTNYKIVCDPTSINPSRARFISYDPHLYRNVNADKFLQYPKEKPPKKIDKVLYQTDDFQRLLKEVIQRRLDITGGYYNWLRVGFAIAHKFGEAGREYFHMISQFNSTYDGRGCDRQFTACLKAHGSNSTTISTFYLYCKQAGLEVYSERTKKIAYSASQGKKSGLSVKDIAANLLKWEGITDAEDLINQVINDNIDLNEDTLIDQLELYMRQHYEMRRNEITRFIECNGKILQQRDLNSIYLKAKKVLDKVSYDLVERLINSDFVPDYNPFQEFFKKHYDIQPTGLITRVFSCIKTVDAAHTLHFGTKWLVSMISTAHGAHSPLLLVLSGHVHGTGKTQWFRRLLPEEFTSYYAESKLDRGKDDEILMTQKLLVVDDEYGGKSKKESKILKDLTSKQVFTLREPYGKYNVDLLRLALLGATSNDDAILDDPTGNRRVIPVPVISIDNEEYNKIDKVELIMEAYHLWRNGFDWEVLGDEMRYLNKYQGDFQVISKEAELIMKYFEPGDEALTPTEILVHIELQTKQRLDVYKLGRELKRLGFQQKQVSISYSTKRCWLVKKVDLNLSTNDVPF